MTFLRTGIRQYDAGHPPGLGSVLIRRRRVLGLLFLKHLAARIFASAALDGIGTVFVIMFAQPQLKQHPQNTQHHETDE